MRVPTRLPPSSHVSDHAKADIRHAPIDTSDISIVQRYVLIGKPYCNSMMAPTRSPKNSPTRSPKVWGISAHLKFAFAIVFHLFYPVCHILFTPVAQI
jgi:hypothetical protein